MIVWLSGEDCKLAFSFAGVVNLQNGYKSGTAIFARGVPSCLSTRNKFFGVPSCTGSSSSKGDAEDPGASPDRENVPFGYSRKDVLLIGLGLTVLGVGLKSGLEFVGVDPLQAGNVVQLVLVLGLTIGWISTYMFRVSNKDMTYAKQLKDYEYKVMEKRLEGLNEAELQALLEQVEEEKSRLGKREQA
ncbi:uncharacterized protein A4U43_C08F32320 [Asparagus officinalis]|uniref:uncharacterized protein LOC109822732 n=1 Tax=Asparagus officinalis TaxID=4686 RepID=UPI00098E42CF|nr:uncharacterized protein LOC109822732 [Asparagus officinalis]ONK61666.1 uncharacterized protein A4U43_C08F32320 [Asparagus officinalis]